MDSIDEGSQRLPEYVAEAGCLQDQPLQLRQEGAARVGLEVDTVPLPVPFQDAGCNERGKLPL